MRQNDTSVKFVTYNREDKKMMEEVWNLNKKKVCEIDTDKLVVKIVKKDKYITEIRYDTITKRMIVNNTMKH